MSYREIPSNAKIFYIMRKDLLMRNYREVSRFFSTVTRTVWARLRHICNRTVFVLTLSGVLSLYFLLLPFAANASECESSTVARKLGIEKAKLSYETLDKKSGTYVATLKNGDLVMASFLRCGLGMHAHLYSRKPIASEQRAAAIKWLLAAVLTSEAEYASVEEQVNIRADYADGNAYTFDSDNEESYSFEFKPSESPLFHTVLHYRWNPPLH